MPVMMMVLMSAVVGEDNDDEENGECVDEKSDDDDNDEEKRELVIPSGFFMLVPETERKIAEVMMTPVRHKKKITNTIRMYFNFLSPCGPLNDKYTFVLFHHHFSLWSPSLSSLSFLFLSSFSSLSLLS